MNSRTTKRFRKALKALPPETRKQAREAFILFREDPHHPSLRFKRIYRSESVYSVRINVDVRAVGAVEGDGIVWFWIGSHADYERLIARF